MNEKYNQRLGSQSSLAITAKGRWVEIMSALAPELDDAIDSHTDKRHVPCPNHGGQDGFRLFYSADERTGFNQTGGAVCNTCGSFSSGLKLLTWLYASRASSKALEPGWGSSDPEYSKYIKEVYKDVAFYLDHGHAKNPDLQNRPKRIMKSKSPEELARQEEEIRQRKEHLMKMAQPMWNLGQPNDPYIQRYFASRQLPNVEMSPIMRFNPSIPYLTKEGSVSYEPAIVMPITRWDNQEKKLKIIALHRIYLKEHADGRVTKAPFDDAKKMLVWGDLEGAAIRMYPGKSNVLALAEGPETIAAIHTYTGIPGWSCVTAWGLEHVQIPDEIDTVLIAQDFDVSQKGQTSALALAERVKAMGKNVVIISPEDFYDPAKHKKGVDWDDAFKEDPERAKLAWSPYMEISPPSMDTGRN